MLNYENGIEVAADIAEMEANTAKMKTLDMDTDKMAKICNEISMEYAEMEAKAKKMRSTDVNEMAEMAEKLNVIAAGLTLLSIAEYGLTFCLNYCDSEDPGEVGNIKVGFDNYDMSIKPFAVALHEYKIDGLIEYLSYNELLDLLDPLVIEVEDMAENGLIGEDKEAAEVIKNALRNRKRR